MFHIALLCKSRLVWLNKHGWLCVRPYMLCLLTVAPYRGYIPHSDIYNGTSYPLIKRIQKLQGWMALGSDSTPLVTGSWWICPFVVGLENLTHWYAMPDSNASRLIMVDGMLICAPPGCHSRGRASLIESLSTGSSYMLICMHDTVRFRAILQPVTLPSPLMMIPLLDDESYWRYPCRDNLTIPFMHYWYRCLPPYICTLMSNERPIANSVSAWNTVGSGTLLVSSAFSSTQLRLVDFFLISSYMMITTQHNDKHMSKLLSGQDEQFFKSDRRQPLFHKGLNTMAKPC